MQVMFLLVATQKSPMDLNDIVVTRTIRDHEELVEVGLNLKGLEFVNSEFVGLEWCHPSTVSDSLAMLPEVYEVPVSLRFEGITISPHIWEVESEEEGELSPQEPWLSCLYCHQRLSWSPVLTCRVRVLLW